MNGAGTALRPSAGEDARDAPALRALFEAQRRAWSASPPAAAQRAEALRTLERAIVARQHDIAAAVAEDFGGRAPEETHALELVPLLGELRHARRHLTRWMAPRRVPVGWSFWPARARIVHQPLGVVGVLSPWNYPIYLTLSPLAGILAAGNHALVKPSELAPASAELMRAIVAECVPATYVSVVTGGSEVAADFVRLPFDHLLFTGSTRVGRLVLQAASEHLVPVTLELGGKSPAIVHETYPMAKAAIRILTGKLYNAGQTCVAPDYVLVPQGRAGEFAQAAAAAAARLYPSLAGNRDYTRIISGAHYQRLTDLVDDARRRGAGILESRPSGDVCDASTRVFPPTIVTDVRDDMMLMQEEIFGPVLPIVEYRRLEDAMAYVSARPRPLALYYFDADRRRVDAVLDRVVCGGVTVNDCLFHVGQSALPFGGVGPSGMGRYHGFAGFETFSNTKGVLLQGRWSPVAALRPPYGPRARRILRFLLR